MEITIKCDQMADGWNYDTCWNCKRFTWSKTAKGSNWRCKLNNGSVAEKRNFYMIWAMNYLIGRSRFKEIDRGTIVVDYVGKRKRGRKNVKKLRFVGVDGWDRPVYQDESGQLWKDVNLGDGELSLHSACDNDFDGEPDMPIKGEFEIIKQEG